jgi:hypothetical protein
MPRVFKLKVAPPSRLSGILANLHKEPKPSLQGVKKLSLSYAAKNDHFGARCVGATEVCSALTDAFTLLPDIS